MTIIVCASVLTVVDAQQREYVIGPRDVLSVTVWDQPNLSGKFSIESDGTFTFPLVGRVKAVGLAVHEVEDRLKQALAEGYFKAPQLSLAIDQYRSQMVYVAGEVRSAGSYPLTGEMTLIEVLARAGWTTDRAGGSVTITRPRTRGAAAKSLTGGDSAAPEVIRISLKGAQTGALEQNLVLQDGDTVFVPRAETIYVFGEVRNPGTYPIQEQTTVLQALALAGGLTERGSTGRLRIVRQVDGQTKQLDVNLDERVQANDTIVVRERLF